MTFEGFSGISFNSKLEVNLSNNNEITSSTFTPDTTNEQTYEDVYYKMGYFDDSNEWKTVTESQRESSDTIRTIPSPYSLTQHQQIGNDIDGEADSEKSGDSVSLSSDGTIVAAEKFCLQ